jgi:polyisoprenoid-binding protein YceI
MITHHERSEPKVTASNRSHPPPTGTWTIDPADTIVSFAWRTLRHWTTTRRLHGVGVIHLDALPPVGVVRFHQPSGLPVLTMALDPASLETGAADLDAMRCGPDAVDVMRPWWWTLRSQSLEVLPSGTWRVMATLTAWGSSGLVELRLELDPKASRHDRLVLRGRGMLDRRALGTGKRASIFDPRIQLELAVHATRVETRTSTERQEEGHLHNQPGGLSQLPTAGAPTHRHHRHRGRHRRARRGRPHPPARRRARPLRVSRRQQWSQPYRLGGAHHEEGSGRHGSRPWPVPDRPCGC